VGRIHERKSRAMAPRLPEDSSTKGMTELRTGVWDASVWAAPCAWTRRLGG
jgi:hypothetical protein